MLLFLVLLVLLGCAPSWSESEKSFSDCASNLHMADADFALIIECLARSTNLTALWEATLWRMELLERLLDKLHANLPVDKYNHTPYEYIDDVMAIRDKMVEQDCQGQLHVIQAVRRKLFWHSLRSGTNNTLFAWPWPTVESKPKQEDTDPPWSDISKESLDDLRCTLMDAIQEPQTHACVCN